ncbi:MAG: hypothetical protein EZS28_010558 [Streblomastix strix]|uniref:Uncharacterized protein n=1 Tax=Streblomastix strix TaxID=222440 RepID=A0A5J4WHS8_9EUKA|nr:MAG: hypothetical protein EZS28_010558 [Streblomastix strix]
MDTKRTCVICGQECSLRCAACKAKDDDSEDEDESSSEGVDEKGQKEIQIEIPKFPLSPENLQKAVKAAKLLWKIGDDESEIFDPEILAKHMPYKFIPFISYFLDLALYCIAHPKQNPPSIYNIDGQFSYLWFYFLKNDWMNVFEIEDCFHDFYPKLLEALILPGTPEYCRWLFIDIWDYSIKWHFQDSIAYKYNYPSTLIRASEAQSGTEFARKMMSSVQSILDQKQTLSDCDSDDIDEEQDNIDDGNDQMQKTNFNQNIGKKKKKVSELQMIIRNLKESGSVEILKRLLKQKSGEYRLDSIASEILSKYSKDLESTPQSKKNKSKRKK